jgi:ribosomal protein S27AE
MTDQRRLELCGISIGGLNPSARERIEVIGFDAWLDEVAGVGTVSPIGDMIKPIAASKPNRTRRQCDRCGEPFLAKRADATYCSEKCRKRASRDAVRSAKRLNVGGLSQITENRHGQVS